MSVHQKSLLNLAGAVGYGDFAYLNFIKNMRSFQASGTFAYPGALNANGFPVGTLSADVFGIITVPTSVTGAEDWIIDWAGQVSTGSNIGLIVDPTPGGANVVSGGANAVGGAFTLNCFGSNGKVRFNCQGNAATTMLIKFPTTGNYSGFTSLRLYPAKYESLINSGEVWYPPFLDVINTLKPGVLRFLDLTSVNASQSPGYAYLPGQDVLTYSGPFWPAWAGTISGTDTYSCSAPSGWGGLVDKAIVQGQFTNANTIAGATLNVGGTGGVPIWRMGGVSATGQHSLQVGSISANSLGTLIYDQTLGAWLYRADGLTSYLPLSLQVNLCNRTLCDFWFQVPAYWSDSDVVSAIAYIRDNLDSRLKCHLEFSNEIWNAIFEQTNWSYHRGEIALGALGFVRQVYGWYALRVRQIMEAATSAWSPRSLSQLRRVMAYQFQGSPANTEPYRFQGVDLGSFGYNVAPNRPIDWCDVESAAPYLYGTQIANFDGNYHAPMTEALAAADGYASSDPARMSSALDFADSDVRAGSLDVFNSAIFPSSKTLAQTYNKQFVAYEGGYECLAPTTSRLTALGIDASYAAKINNLIVAYKNDDRFRKLYLDFYQKLVDGIGPDAVPAQYALLLEQTPIWQWALYPGNIESTPYKSFDAIVEWNNPPAQSGIPSAVPILSPPGNKILTIGGITGG